MFSLFEIYNLCGKTKRYFNDKVHWILEREYFKETTDYTSEKVDNLVKSKEYAQKEHFERLLKERQKRIDEKQMKENKINEELRGIRDNVRVGMYRATIKELNKEENMKDDELEK